MVADIRAFDAVNETAGHDAGDELLRVLGRRLAADLPAAVVVGRTGGDEFTVVPAATSRTPGAAADAVRASLAAPVEVGERTLTVDARCGVASPRRGDDARTLLRAADSALQSARRDAGMVIVHDSAMADGHRHQLELADRPARTRWPAARSTRTSSRSSISRPAPSSGSRRSPAGGTPSTAGSRRSCSSISPSAAA